MDNLQNDPSEGTRREYHLKCRVKFVKGSTEVRGKKVDRTMAILVPQESDERTFFLSAWLPETKEEHFELVGFIPYPVDSNCRFSIHRAPDAYSDRHYLFVMTKGVEETFVDARMEGREVLVRIYSEEVETAADKVRDSNHDYQVYQE